MKPELTTVAGLILMSLMTVGAASAAEQIITPAPLQRAAAPGQPVAFTVGYTTANPCSGNLTGLGLRIHWDSHRLAFVSLTDVRPAALIAQGPVEDDSTDADADPATDQFVQVAWADLDAAWPGGGCTAVTLYTANFNTLAGLTGPTPIRFSASSTAAGYALSAVPATVTLPSYPITAAASPVAGGTVTCTPNPVPYDASSTCTAAAKTGYAFTGFGGACAGASCTLTNVTAAQSVTANFSLAYAIAATASPVVGGTVQCTPNPVPRGGSSTCTAAPNTGYALSAFTGCTRIGTTSQCTLTGVIAAKTVTATFVPAKYPITATASPAAGGTVTCTPNPVTHGASSTCTATAKTGYSLGAFGSGCTRIGTTSQCTLTGVTAPTAVTVTFVLKTYPITATANPAAGGTVTCTPNPVTHGTGSTCTAAANVGYTLSAFTGCTRTGTTSQCTLTGVIAAKSVTATFILAK